jgi:hypothetical protein
MKKSTSNPIPTVRKASAVSGECAEDIFKWLRGQGQAEAETCTLN